MLSLAFSKVIGSLIAFPPADSNSLTLPINYTIRFHGISRYTVNNYVLADKNTFAIRVFQKIIPCYLIVAIFIYTRTKCQTFAIDFDVRNIDKYMLFAHIYN